MSGDGTKSDDGKESDGLSDIDVFELFGLSDDEEEYEGEGNGDAEGEQKDGASDAADTDAATDETETDGGFFRLPDADDEGAGIGADGADDTAEIAAFDLASREVGDETSPVPAEEMTEEAADEPASAEEEADTQDAAEPEEPEKVGEPEQTTGTYKKRTYRMRKKASSAALPEEDENADADADAAFGDETSSADINDDAFDTDAEDNDILAALKAEYGDDDDDDDDDDDNNNGGADDNDEELETKEYDEYHYFFGFGKKKNKKDKGKK